MPFLGGRISRELIRTGEERAKVEAVFQTPEKLAQVLNDMGIDTEEDGTLVYPASLLLRAGTYAGLTETS